jgi:hypothetical protein
MTNVGDSRKLDEAAKGTRETIQVENRKYIVALVAAVLLIWGPVYSSPWWIAIRLGYLILIPLGVWFLLGWIWRDCPPQSNPELNDARMEAIKPMAIAAAATIAIWYWLVPLYVELQISLYGKETHASIVKVETFERDDGERGWTVDLINYTFRTEDGCIFAGVNDANSSQTDDIIGPSDDSGRYPDAKVQYVRSNPKWHRLKGWGYDGFGPPNSILEIAFRMVSLVVLVAFAYWYAYSSLFRRLHGNRFASRERS